MDGNRTKEPLHQNLYGAQIRITKTLLSYQYGLIQVF